MKSVVYFLQTDGDGSAIKIGFSVALPSRLIAHSHRWPRLRLMATMPGNRFTEWHVHDYFKQSRVSRLARDRELFFPTQELLDLISSLVAVPNYGRSWLHLIGAVRTFGFLPSELKSWREAIRLSQRAAASMFDVPLSQYRAYEHGRDQIDAWTSERWEWLMIANMARKSKGLPLRDLYVNDISAVLSRRAA